MDSISTLCGWDKKILYHSWPMSCPEQHVGDNKRYLISNVLPPSKRKGLSMYRCIKNAVSSLKCTLYQIFFPLLRGKDCLCIAV